MNNTSAGQSVNRSLVGRHKSKWQKNNIYTTLPVDGDTIRLFVLHPSSDAAADIEFSLRQADLAASKGNYEALSYTWGELHSTRRIFLRRNGSRLPVNVRENLYNCLLRLRPVEKFRKETFRSKIPCSKTLPSKTLPSKIPPGKTLRRKTFRTLWIDAICINQDDLTEKGLQITLMPRIYSGAQRVLAWLGEAASYSEIFSVSQGRSVVGTEAFLRRPYWQRTWIIQELLNARAITFQCGNYRFSETQISAMIPLSTQYGLTKYQSRAQNLLDGIKLIREYRDRDGGFSRLLAISSESKCANKLDIVYALLGILPKSAPALKIPIDYAATTTQLYIRAVDQMDSPPDITAAESLRCALDLTWPTIIVAMHETENRLDVSQCHFYQPDPSAEWSLIDGFFLTGGDPTPDSPQYYIQHSDPGSSYAWVYDYLTENSYADMRRKELRWFEESEQGPVWAIHGPARPGDRLFELLPRYTGTKLDCSAEFALVFRPVPDQNWPCIGCAWKQMSPKADDTPAESRTIREHIVSSGLFLHAYMQVLHTICAPSRLFALAQAYEALEYSRVRQPAYQEIRK